LVGMHQTQSIADCVRDVKSNSSAWVHENFSRLKSIQWKTKYGAFSVSESSVDSVKAYIANQKEHHKTVSFKEEFLAMLRKHGIEFDERYVFE
ncbi:MAG: transposase, partial [Rubripirellula sp.]